MANSTTQTVRAFLTANFGDDAEHILDMKSWGNVLFHKASFTISGEGARLQTSCGGDAIVTFHTAHRPLFLVRDDNAGQMWRSVKHLAHAKLNEQGKEAMTEDDWKAYHAPRPHAVLRLVASA